MNDDNADSQYEPSDDERGSRAPIRRQDKPQRADDATTEVTERKRIEPHSSEADSLAEEVRNLESGDPTVELQMSEAMLAEWKRADAKRKQNLSLSDPETSSEALPTDDERTAKRSVSDAIEVDAEGFVVFLSHATPRGDIRLPSKLQQMCLKSSRPLLLVKARLLGEVSDAPSNS